MMDDPSDSDDSLKLAEKSWNRVIDGASKSGYREGIEQGSQAIFQEDFDRGYEDGFKAAFQLGKYKGIATAAFSKTYKHPDGVTEILEKTRRGSCYICSLESKEKLNKDNSAVSSTDIIDNHRKHVASTLQILKKYFEPFTKENNVDIS